MQTINTEAELAALYGEPGANARYKELDRLSEHYRAFVEKAPFVLLATVGAGGMDCSPRGDAPGFVRVTDDRTLLLPDRRGNNRLDSLRNIVVDGRVALLFLIPGVGETLRVNGSARLLLDDALNSSFAIKGKAPRCVVEVAVEVVYFQCQKALARSRLWQADAQIERSALPSTGTMLQAMAPKGFDGAAYDAEYPERMERTIY